MVTVPVLVADSGLKGSNLPPSGFSESASGFFSGEPRPPGAAASEAVAIASRAAAAAGQNLNRLMSLSLKFHVSSPVGLQPLAQHRETLRHVRTPESDPQAVCRHGTQVGSIDARGKEQNARLLDEPARKFLHALRALVADEADAAAVRLAPIEQMRVVGEKFAQDREILSHHRAVPQQNLLARLERDSRQYLGRRRVSDGEGMFVAFEFDQGRSSRAVQPADAQSRQPIGLRHHVQRYAALA